MALVASFGASTMLVRIPISKPYQRRVTTIRCSQPQRPKIGGGHAPSINSLVKGSNSDKSVREDMIPTVTTPENNETEAKKCKADDSETATTRTNENQ